MEKTGQIMVKICGLTRREDIGYVNQALPELVGFVFAPGSRRYVTDSQAVLLRGLLDSRIRSVGVFVDEEPERVAGLLEDGIIDMAQLHGHEDRKYVRTLRGLTDRPLIQAFRIDSGEDVARAVESEADYILLDHGPGGTGEAFDWSLLKHVSRPYLLAGGLTSENVRQALELANPMGVDVSSGVETDGVKDPLKIQKFTDIVRGGRIWNDQRDVSGSMEDSIYRKH